MRIRPFNGPVNITQEYGASEPGTRRGYHTGVDYAMATGTPIIAPEDGRAESGDGTASTDGRGYFVTVYGDSGVAHCLYHMKQMATVNGRISQGQVVGYSGATGFATGPHLHWETRKSPFDGNSDFPPADWLFADQPVYTPPTNPETPAAKQFVRIFGDYRTLYKTPGGAVITRLLPNQYGGHLDYEILDRSGEFVEIQTQQVGMGWIYVGSDVSSLTQYYNA